jgi:flagellin-like hook-associated protein FlgL
MSRINTNVESLIARRAIDNVNQADTIVAVADSDLQEVSSLNSLQVARENVTVAGSAIRDADFAVETSHLTRARILVSSSTSVLQLANAQPRVGFSAHCDTGRALGCDPLLSSVSFDIGSIVGP